MRNQLIQKNNHAIIPESLLKFVLYKYLVLDPKSPAITPYIANIFTGIFSFFTLVHFKNELLLTELDLDGKLSDWRLFLILESFDLYMYFGNEYTLSLFLEFYPLCLCFDDGF